MIHRGFALLGVLVIAAVSVACGPTDAAIGTTVKSKLAADETAKVAQIDVAVRQKVVTLSGTVDNPAVKERAVAVARSTDGVADVVDQIAIQPLGPGPHHGHGARMMEGGRRVAPEGEQQPSR